MALNDWEMSYGGLTFGGDTAYSLVEVEGLLSLPDVVAANHAQLRRHGLFAGDPFLRSRAVRVTMEIYDPIASTFSNLVDALTDATTPIRAESALKFKLPGVFGGGELQVIGRPVRRQLPVDLEFLYQKPIAVLEFECTSPLITSTTNTETSVELPTTDGGLTFDATFDVTFGVASVGGDATLVNSGNFDADLTFTFNGPVNKPRLTLDSSGDFLEFDVNLTAGQTLVVDTAARTVLLNGTANRYHTLSGTWWTLPPGSETVSFSAAAFDTGTVDISFASTWI